MARRRLAPALAVDATQADVPRAEHPLPRPSPTAPIARVAAEAAGTAALIELSESVARARETGRMVLELPLDAIAADHLTRDRLPVEDEEMAALRASLAAHGQRTPIEVTPLTVSSTGEAALPYGLITGWRRVQALKALHAETGDPRFATVLALLRRPDSAAAAYVAMVEENEIRVGLSHYERARVAALAAARGVFPSEKAALLALFATASRPKRSRIRAFLEIFHALDGTLRFPGHLPERLGLKLVELVRAGGRDRVAVALAAADARTPEAELAALTALLAPPRATAPAPEATPETAAETAAEIRPGVALEERLAGRTLTLRLTGRGVTPEFAAEVRALLATLRQDPPEPLGAAH
jgi:ParB family chromosome partitioning protein